MTFEQAANHQFNPFDVTKVWSHKDYPLIPVGKIILNRNPNNYFAEVEQSAFSPARVVPGIEFSPDKMLQGLFLLEFIFKFLRSPIFLYGYTISSSWSKLCST